MKIKPSLHGFYVRNYWLATIIAALLIFAGGYFLVFSGNVMWGLASGGAGVLLVAVGIAHSSLNRKFTSLYLSEEELVYEEGVLSHHKRMVPIHMITDSTVQRSFFERILGIADLHVNTSGTGETEIIANDFSYAEIEKLHKEIYRLIRDTPASMKRGYAGEKQNP